MIDKQQFVGRAKVVRVFVNMKPGVGTLAM